MSTLRSLPKGARFIVRGGRIEWVLIEQPRPEDVTVMVRDDLGRVRHLPGDAMVELAR